MAGFRRFDGKSLTGVGGGMCYPAPLSFGGNHETSGRSRTGAGERAAAGVPAAGAAGARVLAPERGRGERAAGGGVHADCAGEVRVDTW